MMTDRITVSSPKLGEGGHGRGRSCRCSIGYGVLACAALLLAVEASQARAQAAESGVAAAQAVGTAFLKAIQAADWKAAAGFLDVVPLDHYRLEQIDMAKHSRRSTMTVEQIMRADSTMPRAVAEYQVQRMKQQSQRYNFLEYEFGVTDPDSLAAMSPSTVAERWLQVHDRRWGFLQALKRSHCPLSEADSLLPKPNVRVLGTVVNGSTAYLLYERDDEPPGDPNEVRSRGPHMLTLRRDIDVWWVSPRIEMNSVGLMGVSCTVKPGSK
ncbi:MAG TPA: hypothetical protein VGJ18_12825 [Gemmatimonadaceae bacterium]